MTTLVDAIQRKQEKLTESHILVGHIQKACNRDGVNILFPTRTLTMDCQDIKSIGCKDGLLKAAEHVRELDLACNRLSSFEEVFKLLCWLEKLESLNLSQNPLGYHISSDNHSSNSSFDEDTIHLLSNEGEENIQPMKNNSSELSIENQNYHFFNKLSSTSSSSSTTTSSFKSTKILQSTKHNANDFSPTFHSDSMETIKLSHHLNGNDSSVGCCNGYSKQTIENESSTIKMLPKHLSTPSELALNSGIITPTTLFPCLSVLALNSTYIPWHWVIDLLHRLPNLTDLHVARNNYGADEQIDETFSYHHHSHPNNNNNNNIDNDDNNNNNDNNNHIYPTSSLSIFPHLHSLYYSDNGISNWWTICRLCKHFPGLEQLILLGNPIEHIPFPEEALHTSSQTTTTTTTTHTTHTTNNNNNDNNNNNNNNNPDKHTSSNQQHQQHDYQCIFQNVHTLGLSETLINQWESIDALNEWMPSLTNLRLGNNLPVFQSWIEPDCRAHVIARLPKLTTYNRSVIDSEERESAEREFVRYYGQIDPDQRPKRYWALERQHGRLQPLANIDLSPKQHIRVRVTMSGKEICYNLNVNLKVAQAKRHFCQLFNITNQNEMKRCKLFYFDQVMSQIQGPEELKYPNRNLYSYQIEPGDLFELIRYPDYR
ncbi:unnamed protein product [Schistosoma turkestanicum]|nr:unnamed protein product [Schistosoma turkestanicum]